MFSFALEEMHLTDATLHMSGQEGGKSKGQFGQEYIPTYRVPDDVQST
jgi:hypothetical protein